MSKRKDRTIFTPVTTTDLAQDGGLTYWKQILPEDTIRYEHGGVVRRIRFDRKYHDDCIRNFRERAIDQTMFQLANPLNSHGRDFDPERQRAEVVDMATLDKLPPDVQEKVGGKPGLYAKLRFFDKKSAKVIKENPQLGVSARVRENFVRADGKFVDRAVIHVLGTIDPRVTGMSGWQAADLSYDPDNGYVLDLSNATYKGQEMAKSKTKTEGTATTDESVDEIRIPTDEEIEAMTDEELDAYLALGSEDEAGDATDPGEDEESGDGDATDPGEDEGAEDRAPATTGASLSNTDLSNANAQAAAAFQAAQRALKAQGAAEFREYRSQLIRAGVPAADIDLAAPVLARPDPMVVDLSVTGDSDVDVTKIVRALLEARKGTVDMSEESGHGGSVDLANGDEDPDKELLDAWAAEVPTGRR